MKSKLQNSLAQLHKLKLQMRVQLNQIRPRLSPLALEKKGHSTKKIFNRKYQSTDIIQPPAQKSFEENRDKRRHFNVDSIAFQSTSRSIQRKHFNKHYQDSVILDNSIRKIKSPYLTPKKQASVSPNKYENTSLSDIGRRDKSRDQQHRSCIRVYHSKLMYNPNFI